MENKGLISFSGYKIGEDSILISPEFYKSLNEDEPKGDSLDYKLSRERFKSQPGLLVLNILIKNNKKTLVYNMQIVGFFEKGDPSFSDEQFNKFMGTNAVAILFPLARSIIMSHTALVGIPTIVLPTINFTEFKDWESDRFSDEVVPEDLLNTPASESLPGDRPD